MTVHHLRRVAFLALASCLVPHFAAAQEYQGKIQCAALSSGVGQLATKASVKVQGTTASYERPIIGLDGSSVLGQETGTGTVSPDGTIVLRGGASTSLSTFTATYSGRITGRRVELYGTQNHTTPRKFDRSCSISADQK